MKNIWYDLYQETQNWREKETKREEMIRVQYIKCKKKDTIEERILEQEKRKILCSEYQTEKKKLLREVWLNIGVKKVNIYGDITVKALLDSGVIEIFINKKIAIKHRFKLQKLKKLVLVRNVNSINNSRRAIIYQVKVNVYYKDHIEKIRIDIYDLGRTDVILDMPQLQVHNLEINWEIGEIRMMRCLPICKRSLVVKKDIKRRKKIGKKVRIVKKTNRDE